MTCQLVNVNLITKLSELGLRSVDESKGTFLHVVQYFVSLCCNVCNM
jgi:hypothetical protein